MSALSPCQASFVATSRERVAAFLASCTLCCAACGHEGRIERAPFDLGMLDSNADGALTDSDVQPGMAAIYMIYTPPGGGDPREVHVQTAEARILFDATGISCPPGWGLRIELQHEAKPEKFAVHLWFADTDLTMPAMAPGIGEMSVVSIDVPEIEHGGADKAAAGTVHITSSTGTLSSGWYAGRASVKVAPYSIDPQPTGERFEFRAVSFRDIETTRVSRQPACTPEPMPNRDCLATYQGQCFPGNREACAKAGCALDECDIEDSLPTRVACRQSSALQD